MQCEINKLNGRITCTNNAVVNITLEGSQGLVKLNACEHHRKLILRHAASASESAEAGQQRESWEHER